MSANTDVPAENSTASSASARPELEPRDRLLVAASDLLWERSFYSITVEDICVRAQVRKGSFYYFFVSKTALAVEALQHLWVTIGKPAFVRCFDSALPPLQRITLFLDWVQSLQYEETRRRGQVLGSPFFSVGCEIGVREPEIGEKVRQILAEQLQFFEAAIREAVSLRSIAPCDPHALALCLRSAMEGVLAEARITADPSRLQALTRLPEVIFPRGTSEAIGASG